MDHELPAERAAKHVRMAEIVEGRAGSAGFVVDFVQAAGSIGMIRSEAGPVATIDTGFFHEPAAFVGTNDRCTSVSSSMGCRPR